MSSNDSNAPRAGNKNLVDTAVTNGRSHALGEALEATDVTNIQRDSGPYTVFAPTDEALEKLPKDTLRNWLKPENKAELISVLKYHVMPGRASGANVEKLAVAKMMQVQTATVTKDGNKFQIDGATVTETDNASGNGVTHVFD